MTNSTMNEVIFVCNCLGELENKNTNHKCIKQSWVLKSRLTSLQSQRDQLVEAKEEAYKILSDERYRGNGYEQTDATKWLAKWYNET